MILTHEIYHTLDNRYLTNSRMGDWLKDKRYFREKHITGERVDTKTDALRIGSAVDTFLFEGEKAFREKFIGVSRRNIKNPPTNITELTIKQFDEVFEMVTVLLRQPTIQDIKDYQTQQIIQMDMPLGEHFCGLSCIPDWIKIDGDTCHLVDLKTTNEANEKKHHFKCIQFGYYRQLALMSIIIKNNYPNVKKFTYRHTGIEKDPDSIFSPFAFYLDNRQIEFQEKKILNEIIPAITAEKDFKPNEATWESAATVGEIDKEGW